MFRRGSRAKSIARGNSGASPSSEGQDGAPPATHSPENPTLFKASYVGPISVDSTDDQAVAAAAADVRRNKRELIKVTCLVYASEIVLFARKAASERLLTISIASVRFTGLDLNDKKFVGVICLDAERKPTCHLIKVKEKANVIPKAISSTYQKLTGHAIGERPAASEMAGRRTPMTQSFSRSARASVSRSISLPGASLSDIKTQLRSGIKFEGFYFGHEVVNALQGKHVCQEALSRNSQRWQSAKQSKPNASPSPVVITVNAYALKTLDVTGGEVDTAFIKTISFSCIAAQTPNGDVFCYIAHNERLGRVVCHIFQLPHGVADRLTQAISEAFRMAAEEAREAGKDPFRVTDQRREAVHGELFKRQIHRRDLKAIKQIGAGQFGDVWSATQTVAPGQGDNGSNSIQRAVKLLRGAATLSDKEEFLREAEVMLQLNDPNLVQIVGVALQQKPWLCVLEFMQYGDLRSVLMDCLEKNILLQPYEQLVWCLQLASGMAFMASERLVHMDLAARNCMLTSRNVCKVGDFGLTQRLDDGQDCFVLRTRIKLALKWCAPEGLDDKIFSEASDVWSFGVLMWEILMYGEIPYPDIEVKDIQASVRNGARLFQPENCSVKLYAIMKKCWNADRRTRWSFSALKRMLEGELRFMKPPAARDIGATLHGKTTLSKGASLSTQDDSSVSSGMQRTASVASTRARSKSSTSLRGMQQGAQPAGQAGDRARQRPMSMAGPSRPVSRSISLQQGPTVPAESSTDSPARTISLQPTSSPQAESSSDAGPAPSRPMRENNRQTAPSQPETIDGFDALNAALNDSDSNDSDVESINGFATTEPVLSKRELPATPMEQTPPQLPPRPAEDAPSRSEVMKARKLKEEMIASRAAKLEVSDRAEKSMSLKKGAGQMLRAQAASAGPQQTQKSKIWQALNPQPLWYQTGRDREEAQDTVYAMSSRAPLPQAELDKRMREIGAGPEETIEDIVEDEEGDEEGDEEEEGREADEMDFDTETFELLKANRIKREAEERKHQEELRRRAEQDRRKKQAALDAELAVIREREAQEKSEAEAAKNTAVNEAMQRVANDLVFDFSWG